MGMESNTRSRRMAEPDGIIIENVDGTDPLLYVAKCGPLLFSSFTICKKYRHLFPSVKQTPIFPKKIIPIVSNRLNQSSRNVIFGTIIALVISRPPKK